MKLFGFYVTRLPKSLKFKDQSTKQKLSSLNVETQFLNQKLDYQDKYIRECMERIYKLEMQLAPKCNKCNQILPEQKDCC